jgi:DNA replication factor GINS
MNLEDLRSAQTRERATDGLQDLRDSFYADVAEFIEDLKDRREKAAEAADDPFGDPEVQELTDKIETAEQVVEAIYERRMGKLVKQASLAAAGMPDDENGLTAEEQELYTDLVDRIEANKAHVLDVISGDADPAAGDGEADGDAAAAPSPDALDTGPTNPAEADGSASEPADSSAAAAMGGGLDDDDDEEAASPEPVDSDATASEPTPTPDAEPPEAVAKDLARVAGDDGEETDGDTGTTPDGGVQSEPAGSGAGAAGDDGDDTDRVRVRVTDDVGEILGVDERPYDLEADDVVTLPEANAEPLVQKDAAERLE